MIIKNIKKILDTNVFKIIVITLMVVGISWSITKATGNELDSATDKFSAIGIVDSITRDTLSLRDARGSNIDSKEFNELNLEYVDTVETKTYEPLIISDIQVGDTIIVQGVTNGADFFVKRIVGFDTTPLPQQEDTATSTQSSIEESGTTTESIIEGEQTSEEENSSEEENTQEEVLQENVSTSTEPDTTPEPEETSSTTPVIETISDILTEGVQEVTEAVDSVIEFITPSSEQEGQEI